MGKWFGDEDSFEATVGVVSVLHKLWDGEMLRETIGVKVVLYTI